MPMKIKTFGTEQHMDVSRCNKITNTTLRPANFTEMYRKRTLHPETLPRDVLLLASSQNPSENKAPSNVRPTEFSEDPKLPNKKPSQLAISFGDRKVAEKEVQAKIASTPSL